MKNKQAASSQAKPHRTKVFYLFVLAAGCMFIPGVGPFLALISGGYGVGILVVDHIAHRYNY